MKTYLLPEILRGNFNVAGIDPLIQPKVKLYPRIFYTQIIGAVAFSITPILTTRTLSKLF